MTTPNLATLKQQARELAGQGVQLAEIRRRTGLTYHHVLSATRPEYAARKAAAVKERRWRKLGLDAPKAGDRRNTARFRWAGRIKVPPHAHPLVRQFIEELNARALLFEDVAPVAGLRRATISTWRYRTIPRLDNFEAVLNAIGLKLEIVPENHPIIDEFGPAARPILLAAQRAGDAMRRLEHVRFSPAEKGARDDIAKALAEIVELTGGDHD